MNHFADRLAQSIQKKGTPLCVGIDPRWESLPVSFRQRHDPSPAGKGRAFEEFGLRVLEIAAPHVAVVKPQSAFFEACGPEGFVAQQRLLQRARELGLITILDAKRGDIASTASAYAEAAFSVWNADSLTVNPYLGKDAIEPFLQSARSSQRGLFVLVRTSNAGSGMFQNLNSEGRPLYQHVAEAVRDWNSQGIGECGYGDVGAVVGATHPAELKSLRNLMPDVWFLVPGFGAQGGTAKDVEAAFGSDGLGAIINSSRGITFPFHPDDPKWETAIEKSIHSTIASLPAPR
jgi:orotidine-5'-phosphate decarboxylase